ncbi:cysteine protease 17, putative [Entamoeba histolytica HM-3:IMSS]|uniref:Cysteine protease, putative n=6 Tax=Entamoeba histolytica TaxID=5759 RepID=C4M1N5_ENTH1|nr:cysteine protease, putative [Entamoeba histolytica HM-1:IMSS]EMD46808.1 cysteine protease, putative [Entamoeba histolytica KU27]EMS12322.1 cysteine protease 17, putative [Entamoeba histolytica HM-3:IMSS]ENY64507.1 cysteine protease 17, putative [Entamoeba histolytica HM-1:IMSS-A]GAT95140.1 cysteine protease putative [Entamoeba histolytica]EAL45760.1 cysteine protease, putative [Entamoeba histolytica HM-1:IMSS]|eukprot:XP_651147.1 cysteine protease, putative [Entamoeba histolytica HM-1:IMSS]
MKNIINVVILMLFVNCFGDEFKEFLKANQIVYSTPSEMLRRRAIFEQSKKEIEEFNKEPHSFFLGITQFADKTDEEFNQMFSMKMDRQDEFSMMSTDEEENKNESDDVYMEYNLSQDEETYGREMRRKVRGKKYRGVRFMRKVHVPKKYRIGRKWQFNKKKDIVKELPEGIDFRKFGKLTYIREQTGCGGCWSFASVCALESRYLIDYNLTVDDVGRTWALSEQQLLDCCIENNGCEGGSMERSFRCMNRTKGVMQRIRYPYEAETQDCKEFNNEYKEVTLGGYALVPRGNERALMSAIHKFGVLGIGLDTRSKLFKHYRGGIYYNEECTRRGLSHAMNLVGYGTTKEGQKYYIIRNSWGDWKWGEDGYMRLYRGGNHCGVATNAFFPLFVRRVNDDPKPMSHTETMIKDLINRHRLGWI